MSVFRSDWIATGASRAWGDGTVNLEHTLPDNPLFSFEALAELIGRLPRQNYMLMHTGPVGTAKKLWEEGEIGTLSGAQVIEAIKRGNLWLLIRHVDQVSEPMSALLDEIFRDIDNNVEGGFPTFNRVSDILISSPSAQVYYHFDHNGQALWQVHGSKRVFVYPNKPPFLTTEMLEHTAVYADETAVPYEPWYDKEAKVYELKAGQMIHWPLFSPHRIENLEFSVSYTIQYYTPMIRRLAKTHAANALTHKVFPGLPLSEDTQGPVYAAKALLQAGARRMGLFDRMRQGRREMRFTLDPRSLGQIIRFDTTGGTPKPNAEPAMATETWVRQPLSLQPSGHTASGSPSS
jgi:hypothetical protein